MQEARVRVIRRHADLAAIRSGGCTSANVNTLGEHGMKVVHNVRIDGPSFTSHTRLNHLVLTGSLEGDKNVGRVEVRGVGVAVVHVPHVHVVLLVRGKVKTADSQVVGDLAGNGKLHLAVAACAGVPVRHLRRVRHRHEFFQLQSCRVERWWRRVLVAHWGRPAHIDDRRSRQRIIELVAAQTGAAVVYARVGE